jgi:glycosyltransferase involved in cell wall biosynthesis
MKIVHINTYATGGAARACIRLHQALLKSGKQSSVVFREDPINRIEEAYRIQPVYHSRTYRLLKRFHLIPDKYERLHCPPPDLISKYEVYSSPTSTYEIEKHEVVHDADIINLHWVGDFLNFPGFFKNIDKPVVWTLHDKNPFLGFSHLKIDGAKNKSVDILEKKTAALKSGILGSCKNLSIVSPSNHLMEESQKSLAFKDRFHCNIFNSVDVSVFTPRDKTFSRELFGFKKNVVIIGFLNNYEGILHKGADFFWNAAKLLSSKDLLFVCNGSNKEELTNCQIISTIHDEHLMSVFLSACDAVLITSREENLPNLALEAMACGTPVISTPVGGMPEIVRNGFNGILADELSVQSVKQAIEIFIAIKNTFDSQRIREFAVGNFAENVQAERYTELYNKILK